MAIPLNRPVHYSRSWRWKFFLVHKPNRDAERTLVLKEISPRWLTTLRRRAWVYDQHDGTVGLRFSFRIVPRKDMMIYDRLLDYHMLLLIVITGGSFISSFVWGSRSCFFFHVFSSVASRRPEERAMATSTFQARFHPAMFGFLNWWKLIVDPPR